MIAAESRDLIAFNKKGKYIFKVATELLLRSKIEFPKEEMLFWDNTLKNAERLNILT